MSGNPPYDRFEPPPADTLELQRLALQELRKLHELVEGYGDRIASLESLRTPQQMRELELQRMALQVVEIGKAEGML